MIPLPDPGLLDNRPMVLPAACQPSLQRGSGGFPPGSRRKLNWPPCLTRNRPSAGWPNGHRLNGHPGAPRWKRGQKKQPVQDAGLTRLAKTRCLSEYPPPAAGKARQPPAQATQPRAAGPNVYGDSEFHLPPPLSTGNAQVWSHRSAAVSCPMPCSCSSAPSLVPSGPR